MVFSFNNFTEKMTLFSNLILLNMLYIVCCIPVITIGAATTALHYVIFQYVEKKDDTVLRIFLHAFAQNFRKVTPIWLLHLMMSGMMAAEMLYLSFDDSMILWGVFVLILFVFLSIGNYLYPILGRYETTVARALWNSLAFTFRHPGISVSMITLQCIPVFLYLFRRRWFWLSGIFWVFIGIALIAYCNGSMLIRLFQRYDLRSSESGE